MTSTKVSEPATSHPDAEEEEEEGTGRRNIAITWWKTTQGDG
jgi:hypothetical protein